MGGGGRGGGGNNGGATASNGQQSKPGDWICPSCGHLNFSKNTECKCGQSALGVKRLGMKPGDWTCPNCGDLVFRNKDACKMCGTPKPADAMAQQECPPGQGYCVTHSKFRTLQNLQDI